MSLDWSCCAHTSGDEAQQYHTFCLAHVRSWMQSLGLRKQTKQMQLCMKHMRKGIYELLEFTERYFDEVKCRQKLFTLGSYLFNKIKMLGSLDN